jgi:hypothetical protein
MRHRPRLSLNDFIDELTLREATLPGGTREDTAEVALAEEGAPVAAADGGDDPKG